MKHEFVQLPVATSDGVFTAHYSQGGLTGLDFPSKRNGRVISSQPKAPSRVLQWHRTATAALKAVLNGREAKNLPPMDWDGATPFQQSVWRQMLKLGPGETLSYGEIAKAIGKPKAVRAVGGACGANPIPVLVPCHRVLAANKKIGGFSGGIEWKRKLLEREGLTV